MEGEVQASWYDLSSAKKSIQRRKKSTKPQLQPHSNNASDKYFWTVAPTPALSQTRTTKMRTFVKEELFMPEEAEIFEDGEEEEEDDKCRGEPRLYERYDNDGEEDFRVE